MSASPFLATGVVYHLHAESLVNGGGALAGPYSGTANWTFALTAVPEPSVGWLVGVAALWFVARGARK